VVNPVAVTGPIIDKKSARHSTSVTLIQRMLSGGVPALPHLQLGFVDVRDVADLHLRAMVDPKANGERFLCIAGQPMWLKEVAIVLKEGLGKAAWWVPTIELPSMLIKAGAYVSPMMRLIAGEVDKSKATDNTKAIEMLGWNPLSREESLLATAKSLLA
jgi:nucleoside-diphosphate-sugar epimerase